MRGRIALALALALLADAALAKEEIVSFVRPVRGTGPELGEVAYSFLLDTPEVASVRGALLVIPGGSGNIRLREQEGRILHDYGSSFFWRVRETLKSKGLAIALMEKPSDKPDGITFAQRRDPAHAERDLDPVTAELRKRLPGTRLYLAGIGAGAVSALVGNSQLPDRVDGTIVLMAPFVNLRNFQFQRVRNPTLIVHHMQTLCEHSPYIEASQVAHSHAITLVRVSSPQPALERSPCELNTVGDLAGHESDGVRIILEWISGARPADALNRGPDRPALNETLEMIAGASGDKLETTIYRPDGPGPFPLVLLTHGIPADRASMIDDRHRVRYARQAAEFVRRGMMVAIVMRRGYGRSGGSLNAPRTGDDLLAFGDYDADDLRSVLAQLVSRREVDRDRVVVGGQSGGGLTAMAFGARPSHRVRGLINFAGGVRPETGWLWQPRLISTFESLGRETRVPSVWFYAENDRLFSHGLAQGLHNAYTRAGGGPAWLFKLAPFKEDGHTLFPDPEGIPVWWPETERFLRNVGMIR